MSDGIDRFFDMIEEKLDGLLPQARRHEEASQHERWARDRAEKLLTDLHVPPQFQGAIIDVVTGAIMESIAHGIQSASVEIKKIPRMIDVSSTYPQNNVKEDPDVE